MIRTYTYKLYDDPKYLKKYEEWNSIQRFVYNLAKQVKEESYKAGLSLGKYDLSKQLTQCKKEKDFEWLRKVNARSLEEVIKRLDDSYSSYFRKLKNGEIFKDKQVYLNKKVKNKGKISVWKLRNFGKPKWAKKGKFETITFRQTSITKTNSEGALRRYKKGFILPVFGKVKVFNNNRKIDGKIKQAKLTKKAGKLYLNVIVEQQDVYKNQIGNVCSIDMGITYFAVTSDGEYIDNPKHLFKRIKELRVEQRKLSRKYSNKKEQSNNYYKQKQRVATVYKKVVDCRKDFLHKQSSNLALSNDIIVIEDLNVKNMVKNKRLSKHILDCSWSNFFIMLKYKTNVIKVNPAYSSQECSKCGHTEKANRPTQSIFKCVSCDHEANADFDACQVLFNRYLEEGVSSVDAKVTHKSTLSQEFQNMKVYQEQTVNPII